MSGGFAGTRGRVSPQYRPLRGQYRRSNHREGGGWAQYLPRPTAQHEPQQLGQRKTRGERVMTVTDARRLRSRLEEDSPRGPAGPEQDLQQK